MSDAVDLLNPATFATCSFHDQLARLRGQPGLYRHPEPNGPGFWVVSRYRDALAVYADPTTFSSRSGIRLGASAQAVAAVADQMMVVSDPPRHGRIRHAVGVPFGPTTVARWHDRVADAVAALVDDAVAREHCDAVADLTVRLPNEVICAMMDLPREDWARIGALTTQGLDSPDPVTRLDANAEIFLYFSEQLEHRRTRPGDDLLSMLLHTGTDLSREDLIVNCSGVLTGASETVRYAAAGGLLALAHRPKLWRLLRDVPTGVNDAVEEVLRWTSPGLHGLRTVTHAVDVDGTRLAPGDRVTVWNCSANRDGTVFPDAGAFRPNRRPNRHIAFGRGPHVCLGARVARLELRELLTALVRRVETVTVTGEPTWASSNFIHGLTALPIHLRPALLPIG